MVTKSLIQGPTKEMRARQERLAEALAKRADEFFGTTVEDLYAGNSCGTPEDGAPRYIEIASRGATYRVTVECLRNEG